MIKSAEIPLLIAAGLLGTLVERIVDPYIAPIAAPVILRSEEQGRTNPASSFEPVYIAWMNLQTPAYVGMDGISRSFARVMQEMGYQISNPETFGPAPRSGRAGREGLYERTVPSALPEFGVVGSKNWGDSLSWTGEFAVSKPDQSTDIFGLTEKGYVRLGTRYPDSTTTWYIERWPDGSVDFGNGIIGPSTADIQAANRK